MHAKLNGHAIRLSISPTCHGWQTITLPTHPPTHTPAHSLQGVMRTWLLKSYPPEAAVPAGKEAEEGSFNSAAL